MARLGLDFDNTIVCYDAVFHRAARAQDLIPARVARNKNAVRDHMRACGNEAAWIALQGEVYGPRVLEAEPFEGLHDCLHALRDRGFELCIISHKTRHPFAGPAYDLHAAARAWVERHLREVIDQDEVYFTATKEEKLNVIEREQCMAFVDDLPEILLAPTFPSLVHAFLFDPAGHHADDARYQRVRGWDEIVSLFADNRVAA